MAEQQSPSGIMVAAIVAAVILAAVVVPFSIKGDRPVASSSADDVEARIRPMARVELPKAAAAAVAGPSAAARDGATVFNTVCSACHTTGAAGAPKVGDKGAWAPRIAQGQEALYKSALGGKNAMPPKGGAANLSDAEVKAAVDYLVSQAK